MIANVEIKRIDFIGNFFRSKWHKLIILNLDTGKLMAWETSIKMSYYEGEITKIIYSENFAEQDELEDVQFISDVRRYKERKRTPAPSEEDMEEFMKNHVRKGKGKRLQIVF